MKITEVDHPLLHERHGNVVAGDGDGQVITSTVVLGPPPTAPASRTRLFAVRDGAVVGIGTLLKFVDGPAVTPIDASVATHESGYDLLIAPVPLPAR